MKVEWTREAAQQKDDIWNALAEYGVGQAESVDARVEARAGTLAVAPFQGSPIGQTGRRRLSIPDIQYVMVYRIESDVIWILRLWHTAQDRSE